MRTAAAALLAVVLSTGAAQAVEEPTAGRADSRVRTASYAPDQVLHISSTGAPGVGGGIAYTPVQITLAEGEKMMDFAGLSVGMADPQHPERMKDMHDWVVMTSGNTITVQALHAMAAPVMLSINTIRPDGPGERHYRFALDTREAGDQASDPGAYFAVAMLYPDVIAAQRKAEAEARRAATAARREAVAKTAQAAAQKQAVADAEARLSLGYGGARNWHYTAHNIDAADNSCDEIGPERAAGVSDDGYQTRLLFAPHAALPAPYVIDQDGKESGIQHSQDETEAGMVMTLHSTYKTIVLRRGLRACSLVNDAYDPVGKTTGTGTTSLDVVRSVRP